MPDTALDLGIESPSIAEPLPSSSSHLDGGDISNGASEVRDGR